MNIMTFFAYLIRCQRSSYSSRKKHYIKAPTPTNPLDLDLSNSTGAHITSITPYYFNVSIMKPC